MTQGLHTGEVLIAAPVHRVLTEGLQAAGYTCVTEEQISQNLAYELLRDCTGIITSTRLQLDKPLLDIAPGLKWIGRMGSGMEVIDVPYAESKGIRCYGSPEGNCNAVAEHALGMLLTLIRRIHLSQNEIANGIWNRDENRGSELEGKTIGIIGYGYTGRALEKKLRGFDMNVMVYDKYRNDDIPRHVIHCEEIDLIQQEADIISFHVPLQKDTIRYFDGSFLDRMRKPFILLNTSRGQVVHTETLYAGLKNGKVAGACLDVHEQEPLKAMSISLRTLTDEMAQMSNVVMTPHIAGYTYEALYKMSKVLLEKIIT